MSEYYFENKNFLLVNALINFVTPITFYNSSLILSSNSAPNYFINIIDLIIIRFELHYCFQEVQ